ncbi:TAXI family TRAP transporter solute-binding subunit [Marinospirillum insulare]|uniref:C4-dicarboxylate ABC transporter substrate-binding protein n=1 Tax=Marinospirillum insulare TaxID=217169 RepID=A0ABQ6A4M9_9GAMM|nr:TAXI family TRAP transporter solute-binding subunit [Marinospirillum insulare]GLR65148.1 C4-dicarboxylate ABC transporter substrate-binding protein [Marinospirillum insulare]
MRKFVSALALSLPLSLLVGTATVQAEQTLSIATGGTGGVYYPIGGGLAEMIGRHIPGYTGVAEVTGASVENMGLIHREDSDLAIALADSVYKAYHGEGVFKGRKVADVRALGSVYPNAVQLVTLADSGINSLSDLKGKRVSLGAPGSGTEVNARTLLEANGIKTSDLNARRLNFNETGDALRDGDIDAGFWSVGPPTSSILSLATSRKIKIIAISQQEMAKAMKVEPVFAPYTLRAGMYEGVDQPVQTLSIPNVLTVNASMSDELAYQITRTLFEKVEELRAIHSAANDTTVEFSLGSTPIPLHPGALRYYQEIGETIPERLLVK